MNKKGYKSIALCGVMIFLSMLCPKMQAYAKNDDATILVSLGDSYSSGEGVEPFYGQDLDTKDKVQNEDWLAHRSEKSWPGRLTVWSDKTVAAQVKDKYWYFRAASGATTKNLNETFAKKYKKGKYEGEYILEPQFAIFDELNSKNIAVDYVTITIGGNDAGFAKIIESCVLGSKFLNVGGLSDKLENVWSAFDKEDGIKNRLIDTYVSLSKKAPDAEIIVVGYPQLLDKNGKGMFISKDEAEEVNTNVSRFNDAIQKIVNACENNGINICFVSVEDGFNGHEAYSEEPYIHKVILTAEKEDLKDGQITSSYSIHPNTEGVKVYADFVQKKIDELEKEKLLDSSDTKTDPKNVVVKFLSSFSAGNFQETVKCLEPKTERKITFLSGVLSFLAEKLTGEKNSLESILSEEFGITPKSKIEILECYTTNLKEDTEKTQSKLITWLSGLFKIKESTYIEADVYVKYKYTISEQEHTVEEVYHVKNFKWKGWRIVNINIPQR